MYVCSHNLTTINLHSNHEEDYRNIPDGYFVCFYSSTTSELDAQKIKARVFGFGVLAAAINKSPICCDLTLFNLLKVNNIHPKRLTLMELRGVLVQTNRILLTKSSHTLDYC
jgi:hypothetical protein